MEPLTRGETLVLKPTGTRVMVRRVEAGRRGSDGPQVVLWSLRHGVQLGSKYPMAYLLERVAEGTMRRGRVLDAARVIHEATERNRGRAQEG